MKSLGNGCTPYRIISSIVLIVLALSVIAPITTFAQMNTQLVNPLLREPNNLITHSVSRNLVRKGLV